MSELNALAGAYRVLTTSDPRAKCDASFACPVLAADDRIESLSPPVRPARPERPLLASPGSMPRRRLTGPSGRIALLHAVAHIEFNAIDLAFDMALRFTPAISSHGLDHIAFFNAWLNVGKDEARHFQMLCERLSDYGADYGDLPAHDGLWEAAEQTKENVMARLVVAPMILEARGLDVTLDMADRLHRAGDFESAETLQTIHKEEVPHVALGRYWFELLCQAQNLHPNETFSQLRAANFNGVLKPPFNYAARDAAGLRRSYYESA